MNCQISIVNFQMSRSDQSAYLFAVDDFFEVAVLIHVKDIDGQTVLFRHGGSGEIHDLETAADDFVIGDLGEFRGSRVFLRIGGVDTVHTRTFEHNIGFDLQRAE